MGGGEILPSTSSTSPRHPPPSSSSKPHTLQVRVLTHNIRYATSQPFPGECFWSERLPLLAAQLCYHAARFLALNSIIFLQEALHGQLISLLDALPPSYRSVGRARDDGDRQGEYAAILFDADVWEVVDGSEETVWLNTTGEVGKKGWDAASVRVVTCVVLRHRWGKRVLCLNTHLDDQGVVSRRMGAKMVLEEMKARSERYDVDAVVMGGDLNSEADEVGGAYQILGKDGNGVVDVRILAEAKGKEAIYGDSNTFTGFNGKGDGEGGKRIDFLFFGGLKEQEQNRGVVGYAVLPNLFEDGVYLSDHRAVVVDVVI